MYTDLQNKYIISEFHGIEVDKKLIKEAIETNSTITIKCILQKADTTNRNGRVYPFKILKREVDKYQQLVDERSAMGECVPAGTEILTLNGWKDIKDVCVNDEIYTLNLDNNNIEIQSVSHKIQKKYNDELIHIYNDKNLDMLTTKNHKFVIWDRNNKPKVVLAKDIYNKINSNNSLHHFYIKNGGEWIGKHEEYFYLPNSDIKIKSEDWAAFLGIFISEGHTSGSKSGENRGEVTITQVKEESKKEIEKLLNKLPFTYSIRQNRQFVIKNNYLFDHLSPLGNSTQKYLPQYTKGWSKNLLDILLKWLLIGDGKNRKNRKGELLREYCTVSKKLSEDIEEIILKLGNGSTTSIRIPENRFINDIKIIEKEVEIDGVLQLIQEKVKIQRLIKAENSNPLYIIHEKTTKKGSYLDNRFVKTELVPFNDDVYCVSVPNKTWLMKYNGKINWTHNCDHPDSAVISLSNVSHLVTEMHWEGNTLYGSIEIADTPAGNIVKGLLKSGIKLGISSRGVGSVKSVNGNDVVQEDFELLAFDIVSSPSTPGAYLFKEGRQWGMKKLTPEASKTLKTEDISDKNINYNDLIKLSQDDFWNRI